MAAERLRGKFGFIRDVLVLIAMVPFGPLLYAEHRLVVAHQRRRMARYHPVASIERAGRGYRLVLAEAYVLVQCAWSEADRLRVEVDGRGFVFRVEFRRQVDGGFSPFIE